MRPLLLHLGFNRSNFCVSGSRLPMQLSILLLDSVVFLLQPRKLRSDGSHILSGLSLSLLRCTGSSPERLVFILHLCHGVLNGYFLGRRSLCSCHLLFQLKPQVRHFRPKHSMSLQALRDFLCLLSQLFLQICALQVELHILLSYRTHLFLNLWAQHLRQKGGVIQPTLGLSLSFRELLLDLLKQLTLVHQRLPLLAEARYACSLRADC
mmetsp:Transcript_25162/g.58443  ORF Transcript_25162/g.58443 Transcript_25162/m.58443 type:complete len:209 (-) Transcript_25162:2620-3246(-)